jgi:hypothetical protein
MRFIGLAVVRAQPPTLRCEVFPAASAVSAPAGRPVAIAKRGSKSITERRVSNEADERVVIKSDGCRGHQRSGRGACDDVGRVLLIDS